MAFHKAVKHAAKLRLAIAGPAGSGKTFTSLTLATALANGGSIALIDTEHGSASKYADLFTFDTLELSNFNPNHYIKAIREAEQAGYTVLVIDSLSHAWNGVGGALELVDTVAKRAAAQRNKDPNSFNAWGEVTPLQNRLIDTILGSSLHIIATMRTKTEYVVETVNGKSTPRKIGMAPIQRADVEYEFDIYADMDIDNTMIIQKSRCSALYGQVLAKPDGSLAEVIQTWLAGPPAPTPAVPLEQGAQAESNGHASNHLEAAQRLFASTYNVQPDTLIEGWNAYKVSILGTPVDDSDLTDEQLARVHGSIVAKQKEQAQQRKPARTASTVQAWFAKVYKVAPTDLDTRWTRFKAHVLGAEVADADLTEEQLNQINAFASQQYQKQQSQRLVQKVS
jgi:hypothetical protein